MAIDPSRHQAARVGVPAKPRRSPTASASQARRAKASRAGSVPASDAGRVAYVLGHGVLHAPEGVAHSLEKMAGAIVHHPLASGAVLVGTMLAPAPVATVLIGAGTAMAGYGIGRSIYRAIETASSASDPAALRKAVDQAGDAYGDTLVNAAMIGLPLLAGNRVSARAGALIERALSDAKAAPAPAATPSVPTGAVFGWLKQAIQGPIDDLPADLRGMVEELGPEKQKSLLGLVMKPDLLAGSKVDAAALAARSTGADAGTTAVGQLFTNERFLAASAEGRVAMLLDAMGPGFTKLAQVYGSADTLPPGLSDVLKVSRSQMPEMPREALDALLSQEPQTPEDVARGIYRIGGVRYQLGKVLGVASIGEVRQATDLETGRTVVIKLRKPSATPASVEQEFRFMRSLVDNYAKYSGLSADEKLQTEQYLDNFRKGVLEELDLRGEASNAARFAKTYEHAGFSGVDVRHVSPNGDVLVMNQAEGIPLTKIDSLPVAEQQEARMAYLRSMFRQIFGGYFHADPHPGNVFWNPSTKRIQYIDMGAMGEFTGPQQLEMSELLLSLLSCNPDAVAQLMIRNADRITSTVPPAELQARLSQALSSYFAQAGKGSTLTKQAVDVFKICQDLGVWPKDNGFWFNKTMFTVASNLDPVTSQRYMAELMPYLGSSVVSNLTSHPGQTLETVVNVARAARKNPGDFLGSVAVMANATPESVSGFGLSWARLVNGLATPARIVRQAGAAIDRLVSVPGQPGRSRS